ncbi:hypothetical protein SDC9_183140 [bioreactor metagenome]|uniref:Uncharacterized protein n=1 Tax=bioreactor metagenome TaxID=1076179 RepID=A0A645HB97_9ZZZZ
MQYLIYPVEKLFGMLDAVGKDHEILFTNFILTFFAWITVFPMMIRNAAPVITMILKRRLRSYSLKRIMKVALLSSFLYLINKLLRYYITIKSGSALWSYALNAFITFIILYFIVYFVVTYIISPHHRLSTLTLMTFKNIFMTFGQIWKYVIRCTPLILLSAAIYIGTHLLYDFFPQISGSSVEISYVYTETLMLIISILTFYIPYTSILLLFGLYKITDNEMKGNS